MIVTVTNSATLAAALKTVHDGDTIQLSSGEYVLSKLQGLNFASGVTITSADPTHAAIVDGLNMQNVSGLTFTNLEVKVDEVQGLAIKLNGGSNDHFSNLDIHGSAVGDGGGVQVMSASNVTLSNLDVHDLHVGMGIVKSDHVSITNSQFHNIQIDGIQSLGTSNETISGNYFTNFYPKAGDHSDAIQFVTATTTTPTHDITITNNTYVRGVGEASTQGIFVGNEAKIPYENVTITGNTIVGGIYQGIMVSYANNLTLTHNTVEGYTDINSWIYVNQTTHATVSNNVATTFNLNVANPGLVATNNTTIPLAHIGDTSLVGIPGVAPAIGTPLAPLIPLAHIDDTSILDQYNDVVAPPAFLPMVKGIFDTGIL